MRWTDLNLSALQYFVDSVELNSITAAAQKNNISRPAISQALKRLEIILGYDLIDHKKNNLKLTDKGLVFFQTAKSAIANFTSEFNKLDSHDFEITIATSATIAEYFLLPALKKLKPEQRKKIKIKIGTSHKVQNLVLENEAKIGLLISDNIMPDLESVVLQRGHFVLLSKSGELTMPLITTEPREEVIKLKSYLKMKKISIDAQIEVESWGVCNKILQQLGGTSLVPEFVQDPKVKIVDKIKFKAPYQVQAIYKNINSLNLLERTLLDIMK